MDSETIENVNVCCRIRPINQFERKAIEEQENNPNLKKNPIICLHNDSENENSIIFKDLSMQSEGCAGLKFHYDRIFDERHNQLDVYNFSGKNVVEAIFSGINCSIMSYGQSGSGKTHSTIGPPTCIFTSTDGSCPSIEDGSAGLVPRILYAIFDKINNSPADFQFMVSLSAMEIYMEKVYDLLETEESIELLNATSQRGKSDSQLAPNQGRHFRELQVHDVKGETLVDGMGIHYLNNASDGMELIQEALNKRAVSSTGMNLVSSRSHGIFLITVKCRNTLDNSITTGKLYICDLAGSEKVSKTRAEGTTLDEAKMINKSLLTLGIVVATLAASKGSKTGADTFIPYRDSKLTRILKNALGGNSRTYMIICVSPAMYNSGETLSTLRFGERASKIQTKTTVNKELTSEQMKQRISLADKHIRKCHELFHDIYTVQPRTELVTDNYYDNLIKTIANIWKTAKKNGLDKTNWEAKKRSAVSITSQDLEDEDNSSQKNSTPLLSQPEIAEAVANMKQQMDELAKELVKEREKSQTEIEEYRSKTSTLQTDLVNMKTENVTLTQENSELKGTIGLLEGEYERLITGSIPNLIQLLFGDRLSLDKNESDSSIKNKITARTKESLNKLRDMLMENEKFRSAAIQACSSSLKEGRLFLVTQDEINNGVYKGMNPNISTEAEQSVTSLDTSSVLTTPTHGAVNPLFPIPTSGTNTNNLLDTLNGSTMLLNETLNLGSEWKNVGTDIDNNDPLDDDIEFCDIRIKQIPNGQQLDDEIKKKLLAIVKRDKELLQKIKECNEKNERLEEKEAKNKQKIKDLIKHLNRLSTVSDKAMVFLENNLAKYRSKIAIQELRAADIEGYLMLHPEFDDEVGYGEKSDNFISKLLENTENVDEIEFKKLRYLYIKAITYAATINLKLKIAENAAKTARQYANANGTKLIASERALELIKDSYEEEIRVLEEQNTNLLNSNKEYCRRESVHIKAIEKMKSIVAQQDKQYKAVVAAIIQEMQNMQQMYIAAINNKKTVKQQQPIMIEPSNKIYEMLTELNSSSNASSYLHSLSNSCNKVLNVTKSIENGDFTKNEKNDERKKEDEGFMTGGVKFIGGGKK